MERKWDDEEVAILISKYPDTSNTEMIKILNRSYSSITMKARRICIRKSKNFKSRMISKRNKMVGRDLNYSELERIALLYKTRGQFQFCDPSAYTTALKMKILDDICSHMIRQSYSIPQLILKHILSKIIGDNFLYNSREIIKPYELDIYFPDFKLAFEYDGKRWHKNDKINKSLICLEKNIKLITIVENNRRYEEDIKSQLVKNIEEINIYASKKISISDINDINITNDVFNDILNDDYINNICLKYVDFSIFRKENKNLYEKLVKFKALEKYTSHMYKRGGITEESAITEISKYEYLGELINKSYRYYIWIKKNKKEYLLMNLKLKQNKKLKLSIT